MDLIVEILVDESSASTDRNAKRCVSSPAMK